MRLLAYGDLQATVSHERCRSNPSIDLQTFRVRKFYDDLLSIYKKYECGGLVDLGDTLDDRSAIPVPSLDVVLSGISKFPRSDWNIKLLGNHDQFLRSTAIDVSEVFKPYFTVVKSTDAYACGNTTIHCASYPANDAELITWLEKQARCKGPNILLGHFQVLGCQMNSGQAVTGIDVKKMRFANLVLLGHVHAPQSIRKTIHYVGSPFQQNWGEAGERKRVAIVDTDTCEVNWIPLTGYPEYVEVKVSEFENIDINATEDRFKVTISDPEEAQRFYASPSSGAAEPVYAYDVTATVESTGTTVEVKGWGIHDVMLRYVRKHPVSGTASEVSEEDLLQFGKDIMES